MEKVPCPKCGLTSNMSYIHSIPDLGHCPFIKCDWRLDEIPYTLKEVPGTRTYHPKEEEEK